MSVPKSKRGKSKMEFLYNARKLQIHTIKKCVSFPKRYTFYISQPLANAATKVYEHVKMANSVYPTNAHEAQIRRDYFICARAGLYSIVSQVEVAHEIFGLDPDAMKYWMKIISEEIRLLKGVMEEDYKRYKNLK